MKIKYNIIPKEDVTFVKQSYSLKEALNELENSGYRCIPILDDSGIYFKGNIYVQDIYKALVKKTNTLDESVMSLKKDEDIVMYEETSFFRTFTTIIKYPYLPVLKQDDTFAGILTHANVMGILEDSWGVKKGSYSFTVATHDYVGALNVIVTKINKFCNIQSMLTLDNENELFRRIIITLPHNITEEVLTKVIFELEKDGLRVFHIEKI